MVSNSSLSSLPPIVIVIIIINDLSFAEHHSNQGLLKRLSISGQFFDLTHFHAQGVHNEFLRMFNVVVSPCFPHLYGFRLCQQSLATFQVAG